MPDLFLPTSGDRPSYGVMVERRDGPSWLRDDDDDDDQIDQYDKTAELSQRRPRDAPNIWVLWKVLRVVTMHLATFPQICNGLMFRSILTVCVQNLKLVALPAPEIIGGTPQIWTVPGYAHAPFSPKILKGFCSNGHCEYTCQIWSWELYPFLR